MNNIGLVACLLAHAGSKIQTSCFLVFKGFLATVTKIIHRANEARDQFYIQNKTD